MIGRYIEGKLQKEIEISNNILWIWVLLYYRGIQYIYIYSIIFSVYREVTVAAFGFISLIL